MRAVAALVALFYLSVFASAAVQEQVAARPRARANLSGAERIRRAQATRKQIQRRQSGSFDAGAGVSAGGAEAGAEVSIDWNNQWGQPPAPAPAPSGKPNHNDGSLCTMPGDPITWLAFGAICSGSIYEEVANKPLPPLFTCCPPSTVCRAPIANPLGIKQCLFPLP